VAFTGNYTCNVFKSGLLDGNFDFSGNTFYLALYTNSATLDASTTAYTTTGEASGGNYVAGGQVLTPTVSISNGVAFVTFANVSWTGVITARGALIYKADGVTNPAIAVLDFGEDKQTNAGDFTINFPLANAANAIIQIA